MDSPSTHASLLIRLADPGDPEAWQVFQGRYGALIRDYARRRGLQPNDCDDLLQGILIALTKAMPKFQYDPSKGSFRGYLKTIVSRRVFKIRSQERSAAPLENLEETTPDPKSDNDALWEAAWRQYHVRRALAHLSKEFPESTLNAFRHYVLESRSPVETGELTGLSIDSVYQAKSRVIKRLSDVIAEQVREEG